MFEAISQSKETVVCHSGRKDQVNPRSQIYLFPACMNLSQLQEQRLKCIKHVTRKQMTISVMQFRK